MPAPPSNPGVYVEETVHGRRAVEGVPTSVTAFVGRAPRGPIDGDAASPVRVRSHGDYARVFGGLASDSPMSFAVRHFFDNGGHDALIVRVHHGAVAARTPAPAEGWQFEAASPGSWGNHLRLRVDHDAVADDSSFNLRVQDQATQAAEVFLHLSITPGHPRFAAAVLARDSQLLRVAATSGARPEAGADGVPLAGGGDGAAIGVEHIAGTGLREARRGLYALEKADLFNLLVLPPFSDDPADAADVDHATWCAAIAYATERRAVVLVYPPYHAGRWTGTAGITLDGVAAVAGLGVNAALYFPRIHAANPLRGNWPEAFAPSGAVAGVIARTDGTRGVWTAPAGLEATLAGVPALDVSLTDGQNGVANPLGVNCLRMFPAGAVVWGARTLQGADELSSDWKYLSVRRTALFLEESIDRATRWAAFESNGEALWADLRRQIGAFLEILFRQGAFRGRTAEQAYFVLCDRGTTTPADVDQGVVNVRVGFAPLRPAEFVLVRVRQRAANPAP